nr:PREDICTED: ATP synthase subunit b, mitochondrial [Bemisia tabaci]
MLARQLLRAGNLRHTSRVFSSSQVTPPAPSQSPLEAAYKKYVVDTKPWEKPVIPVMVTEGPERDEKNFPRPTIKPHADPCRFLFIPESWFDMLYNKLGVTGPYTLGGGYIMYLFSKEIWVMDHDLPYVACLFTVLAGTYYKYGDLIARYFIDNMEREENIMKNWKLKNMQAHEDNIKMFEKEIWRSESQKEIFVAKKENVLMQLEAEYRRRANEVYQQVKRRLDYQLQIQTIDRRIAHKHMVNWIIDNVKKSITPQQEKESLKKCFADLQSLAAKA